MKNWKTTLAGCLGAIGAYLATIADPTWLHTVGVTLAGLAPFLIGLAAKDSNVTGGTVQQ